jgi:hypothetical protein
MRTSVYILEAGICSCCQSSVQVRGYINTLHICNLVTSTTLTPIFANWMFVSLRAPRLSASRSSRDIQLGAPTKIPGSN